MTNFAGGQGIGIKVGPDSVPSAGVRQSEVKLWRVGMLPPARPRAMRAEVNFRRGPQTASRIPGADRPFQRPTVFPGQHQESITPKPVSEPFPVRPGNQEAKREAARLIKLRCAPLKGHGGTWVNQEQSFDFSGTNATLNCQSRQVNHFGSLIANSHATSDLFR